MNNLFNDYINAKTRSKLVFLIGMLSLSLVMGANAQATDHPKEGSKECQDVESKSKDIWVQGKLEGAYLLNKYLNPLEIDTEVRNGVVFLSGNVDSDIDKDLAGEIAKSIEGVKDVENKLTVRPENFKKGKKNSSKENKERAFGQKVADASTTAAVKIKLLANSNTDGSDINVDTMNNIVTLKGRVDSAQEKELAGKIAENTDDVLKVVNQLKVGKSKS